MTHQICAVVTPATARAAEQLGTAVVALTDVLQLVPMTNQLFDALNVSDVARDLGIDPKAARAALRRAGRKPKDGRWPKIERGSAEHDALCLFLEGNEDGVDSSPSKK